MERIGRSLRQLTRHRNVSVSSRSVCSRSTLCRKSLLPVATCKNIKQNTLAGISKQSSPLSTAATTVTSSVNQRQSLEAAPASHIPQLIIFDKTGTLFSFHSTWSPWVHSLAKRLEESTAHQLEEKVYRALDVCFYTRKARSGVLAEGTSFQIKRELENLLVSEGCDRRMAQLIVEENWEECDMSDPKEIEAMTNLSELFQTLKSENIKIAVCTSDTRSVTEKTFARFGLDKYVDVLMCGDDLNSLPNPMGHNAMEICKSLNVSPSRSIVIGDTDGDLKMGHNAGFGATIGVLSGVGSRLDLFPYADRIIQDISKLVPLLVKEDVFKVGANRTIVTEREDTSSSFTGKKAGLVIFDKDGTLLCFHSMWTPWAEKLIKRLEEHTGIKNLRVRILSDLGFCHDTSTWGMGLLAEKPTAMNQDCIVGILMEKGLSEDEARQALDDVWEDGNHKKDNDDLKVLDNPQVIFKVLKEYGVKIAVCTADDRTSTKEFLREQKVDQYVDMMVCGDDPENVAKPAPHNAWRICETLNVDPASAVMVGDTIADVGMGHSAQLGASIGVLTGVGRASDLDAMADYVVPSIKHILPIVLPDCHRELIPRDMEMNSAQDSSKNEKSVKMNMSQFLRRRFSARDGGARPFSTSSAHNFIQSRNYQTTTQGNKGYTHVIVGAGSAGCVLANRLSADPANNVLLLEAGPKDKSWKIEMPAALMYNLCDDVYNWFYHTVPQKHMNGRVMYWPRGRVWGGSSSLNAMVYIRGHALDYDGWEKLGATGWSYADCLPYFRKAQTHSVGADDYRGGNGPLHVYRSKGDNPLHTAFLEAGQQAGYPFTDDMNGYQQEGVGYMDMTTYRGQRWSAARAYLYPALYRDNLTVTSNVMATKVLFDGDRAVGIEYKEGEGLYKAYAESDVILSGGAINSPQLLMLSGVGNADDLKKLDIPVVTHRPGVGQNLQDHLEVYVQHKCTKPITLYNYQWKFPFTMIKTGLEWFATCTGMGATTHLETGGFIRTNPTVEHPNLQWHFLPSTVHDHGRVMGHCHSYQVHAGPMRSTSRGTLTLKSKNPFDHPIIDPNYMSNEDDRREMRECIRASRDIFAQKAFDEFRDVELQPGPDVQTDAELDAFVRERGDSSYHPSCTCKMGQESDPMAVVDPQCRVIGLQGLRIVDASIMPHVVSGNLNGPTIMTAEKAADIILGKPPLPKSTAPVWRPKSLSNTKPLFDV